MLEDGRAEGAARILRAALALWRGPAVADLVVEGILGAAAARLDEDEHLVDEAGARPATRRQLVGRGWECSTWERAARPRAVTTTTEPRAVPPARSTRMRPSSSASSHAVRRGQWLPQASIASEYVRGRRATHATSSSVDELTSSGIRESDIRCSSIVRFLMVDRLPRLLLHAEGAAVAAAAIAVYFHADYPWWLLVALALAPDLSMAGYLRGPRLGAACYDAVHTYAPPVVVAAIGVLADADAAIQVGLIWIAHIGVDRMLGYGLKYPSRFKDTHLQRV